MYIIEKLVKDTFRALGIDVGRIKPKNDPNYDLIRTMQHFNIDLVLDVGANAGQFAMEMRAAGYKNAIVSFEPLIAAYADLEKNAARDTLWTVHQRCAIGSQDGEITINVAGNSVSSSILPMLDSHSSVVSESAYCGSELTPVAKLDTVAGQYMINARNTMLKIDTQGYEWEVLDGAQKTLPHVRCVVCEISLVPLYEGQHLWQDIIARMEESGFTLWSIKKAFTDPSNGRTLQVDGVFLKQ